MTSKITFVGLCNLLTSFFVYDYFMCFLLSISFVCCCDNDPGLLTFDRKQQSGRERTPVAIRKNGGLVGKLVHYRNDFINFLCLGNLFSEVIIHDGGRQTG